MKKRFPFLAVLLLIFALAWFLSEIGLITITIPWIPIILIVLAISMIVNRYSN